MTNCCSSRGAKGTAWSWSVTALMLISSKMEDLSPVLNSPVSDRPPPTMWLGSLQIQLCWNVQLRNALKSISKIVNSFGIKLYLILICDFLFVASLTFSSYKVLYILVEGSTTPYYPFLFLVTFYTPFFHSKVVSSGKELQLLLRSLALQSYIRVLEAALCLATAVIYGCIYLVKCCISQISFLR